MLDLFRRLSAKTWVLLILSIVLATGAAGCGSKDSAATAQAKKFRPADAAGDASSDTSPATGAAAADEFGSATPLEVRQGGTGSATGAPPRTDGNARSTPSGKGGDAAVASASAAGSVSPQLQQLLDQFNRLGEQQPKGSNQQEQLEDFVRNQQQRLAVGKKILAMNPDAEVKKQLVPQMYQVFTVFGRVGVPNARQQMTDFAKSLMADRDATIARMGRHMMFDMNVSRLANEAAGDGKGIVAEVQTLLDAEKGQLSEDTLDLASQAAEILMQTGMKDDAVRTLDLIAKAAAADPKLANQSSKYTDTAKLAKADLTTLLTNLIKTGQKEDEQKLVAAISGLLKELKPSRELFSSLQQVGQILETTGNLDAAKRCYDELEQAFQSSEDKDVAETATQIAAGARKRLSLVGQPLNVEGLTPDGKPFDWSAYQGKVVLLDFWATWCGPCLEELPNIQRNFEEFHAKGFEVVGVNLNTNLGDLKEFLTLQDLPWPTVISQVVVDGNAGKDWSRLPMASKCGVDAIPFVVLIGKDGNVDSIHVRGPKLKTRLTQLLGAPITTEIPADPTQPAPPGPAPRTGAKPAAGKQSSALPRSGIASPVAWMMASAIVAADPAATDPAEKGGDEAAMNPYQAKPGLTTSQLVAFLQKMLDRPQVIQTRPGFADALVEACDRVLAAEPAASESEQLVAIETKFAVLHREACDGKASADKQLMAFVEQRKDDRRPAIAREVEFFRLERRVLDAKELPIEEIPDVLKEVKIYAAKERLTAKHLRLASSTVAAINRLEEGDEREALFAVFGGLFAKSDDKELARYGKKVAKKSASKESSASR